VISNAVGMVNKIGPGFQVSIQDLMQKELIGLVFDKENPKVIQVSGMVSNYRLDYDNQPLYDTNGYGISVRGINPRADITIAITDVKEPQPVFSLLQLQQALIEFKALDERTVNIVNHWLVALDVLLSKGGESTEVEDLLRKVK
jgi:hypothetical protein